MDNADLNNDNMTRLSLETPEEKVTVEGTGALGVVEFMDLVELLIVNAKYEQAELEDYIVKWAEDIKATKQN